MSKPINLLSIMLFKKFSAKLLQIFDKIIYKNNYNNNNLMWNISFVIWIHKSNSI